MWPSLQCFAIAFLSLHCIGAFGQHDRHIEFIDSLYNQSLNKSLPFQETVKAGLHALRQAEKSNADVKLQFIHTQLGVLFWNDGQLKNAHHHLHQGGVISLKRKDRFNLAKCLHYRGLVFYYQCEFDSALHFYNEAEKEFRELRRDSAIAKVKSHKSLIYNARGDYDMAIQNMAESYQLQEKIPGYRDFSMPMQFPSQAVLQLYYENKLEKDLEALPIVEKSGDQVNLAYTLQNIALDYQHLSRFNAAIQFSKKSIDVDRKLGRIPFQGSLASMYASLGKYDSALYFFQAYVADLKKRGTQIHLAATYADIANFYKLQNKFNDAYTYFQKAFLLDKKMGLPRSQSTNGKNKAIILIALKKYQQALSEIDQCILISRTIGCRKDMGDFLQLKGQILSLLHRNDEAVKVMEEGRSESEKINNGESRFQIARLQIEYEMGKKNRDLENLQAQNQLKEAAIENKNLLLLLGLVLFALVTGVIVFLAARYQQKIRNEKILKIKNLHIEEQNGLLKSRSEEKEILLHEIHHRVKNNLQIISSLINLKSRQVSPETIEALQQLNGRIFSMGLIHEKLYTNNNIQTVRVDEYLVELTRYVLDSFAQPEHPVHLKLNCQPALMDVESALTCGLINNELLTNSIKYAFADDQIEREVALSVKKSSEWIELDISDNGLRKRIDPSEIKMSFGLRFVDQLVTSKLGGAWSMQTVNGFHAHIKIPSIKNGKNKDHHR
jgi:two-component system, sensor histidine kinase PdtaS